MTLDPEEKIIVWMLAYCASLCGMRSQEQPISPDGVVHVASVDADNALKALEFTAKTFPE